MVLRDAAIRMGRWVIPTQSGLVRIAWEVALLCALAGVGGLATEASVDVLDQPDLFVRVYAADGCWNVISVTIADLADNAPRSDSVEDDETASITRSLRARLLRDERTKRIAQCENWCRFYLGKGRLIYQEQRSVAPWVEGLSEESRASLRPPLSFVPNCWVFGMTAWSMFVVAWVAAAYPSVRVWRSWRARYRRAHNRCVNCGYDLRGNPSDRCSECGCSVHVGAC